MALLHGRKHPSSLRGLLPGWDMLQADTPSWERMETAMAILVGSGLAELDSSWGMRPTEQGQQLKSCVKGVQGMRGVPGAIGKLLAERHLIRATLGLPQDLYDSALTDYLDAVQRRAGRRSRRRWWMPPLRRQQ